MTDVLERKAVISGVGQSEVGRRLYRSPVGVDHAPTVDQLRSVLADAR